MDMKLYSVNAGYLKLDGGAMFGVVPKSIWSKTNPADEKNLCKLAMRSLLIEDAGKLILIDTGMGDKQDAKFFSHYLVPEEDDTLEGSLAMLGFTREDITDVVFTHLHFDHCGGAIIRVDGALVSAFPNATFWSNQEHWDWAVNPNPRESPSYLKENILPIQASGHLKFIDVETTAITNDLLAAAPSSIIENLSFRFANGHTRAMMLPQIKYKDRTIVFAADLLPTVGHVPLIYVMSYDMFPLVTLEERKSFFKEAADNNYVLFLQHDAVNECCTLQHTEKGIRLKDIFKIGDI
jgi:glyoxylase-like metal-dependent hydrolase (beta-lactamase superfamily II)